MKLMKLDRLVNKFAKDIKADRAVIIDYLVGQDKSNAPRAAPGALPQFAVYQNIVSHDEARRSIQSQQKERSLQAFYRANLDSSASDGLDNDSRNRQVRAAGN